MLGIQAFNRNTDKAIKRHNILVEQANKMKEDDEDISYLINPSGMRVRAVISINRK